jgi:hypothetical protein
VYPRMSVITYHYEGTLSVKFQAYVRQMIIFRGILDNCLTFFYRFVII